MGKQWHGGKGDSSRISNYQNYQKGMERLFEKKGWRFWMIWEGRDIETTPFDDSGLSENDKISYKDFIQRLKGK